MPNMHDPRFRSEDTQISTGIHDAAAHARREQSFGRAINREAFGDPAKIDNQSPTEANTSIAHENDVAPIAFAIACPALGQKMPLPQKRGDCDIEHAVAFARKILGCAQDSLRPRMYPHWLARGFVVEPAD